MIKPRTIIISVCSGFILSFVIGLVADVSFGVVLLRALIFAILFGGLSFGIGVVFQRFLLDSSDLDGGSELPSGGARQGSIVDLSVGDEPLVEDENGPDFYVRKEVASPTASVREDGLEESHSSTGAVGHVKEGNASVSGEDSGKEQFRPISLGTPAVGGGGADGSLGFDRGAAGSSEDVLPEIGDISMSPSEGDDLSSGGMELSIGNGMETSQGRGSSAVSEDSSTIAQAIRTVLARDS